MMVAIKSQQTKQKRYEASGDRVPDEGRTERRCGEEP